MIQSHNVPGKETNIEVVISQLNKAFPKNKVETISYEDIPEIAIEKFERYSNRFSCVKKYKEKDFDNIFRIIHDTNKITYIVQQQKTYCSTFDTEDLTYLFEITNNEKIGHGELRYNFTNDDSFFIQKPFVGFTQTENSFLKKGHGLQRYQLMNALTQAFYSLPLHSGTIRCHEDVAKLWYKLEKQNNAKSYQEGNKLRFQFIE